MRGRFTVLLGQGQYDVGLLSEMSLNFQHGETSQLWRAGFTVSMEQRLGMSLLGLDLFPVDLT